MVSRIYLCSNDSVVLALLTLRFRFPCDGAYKKGGGDPNYGTTSINMVVEIGKDNSGVAGRAPNPFH